MTRTREKLIKLLLKAGVGCDRLRAGEIADRMIAHGVTVQKWIPVTERLPEEDDYYLCCVKYFLHPGRSYINILEFCKNGFREGHIYSDEVTHWMPLPDAPGEGC